MCRNYKEMKNNKVGAPKKYKKPLIGVYVRVANKQDKAIIKDTEKRLLDKHKILQTEVKKRDAVLA